MKEAQRKETRAVPDLACQLTTAAIDDLSKLYLAFDEYTLADRQLADLLERGAIVVVER